MDIWNEILLRLRELEMIEWLTFGVNALVFLFSKKIASSYGEVKDAEKMNARLRILHGFNLVVFLSFVVSVAVQSTDPAKAGTGALTAANLSQSCLILLIAYLLIHLAEALLLKRYGQAFTVMGFTRRVETSTSRTLELLAYTIIALVTVILLFNIWAPSALQTTGVIGFIAVMIFTTKDYWMRDFIAGIILISNERIQRGQVVAVPSEDVLAVVLEIRGLQTSLRDLVRANDLTLPNSIFLRERVDIFCENPGGPFRDYVDFKIGYGATADQVQRFLKSVHLRAAEASQGMEAESGPMIALKENGDHATRWRLGYVLTKPEELLTVRDAVNLAAYEMQEEFGLDLSTPTTHVVASDNASSSSTPSSASITGSADNS